MRRGKLIAALALFLGVCAFTNRASACYDPSLGRWLQQDPAGYVDGCNSYQFVNDNPIVFVDAFGLSAGNFTVHINPQTSGGKSGTTYTGPGSDVSIVFHIPNNLLSDSNKNGCICSEVRFVQIADSGGWSGWHVDDAGTDRSPYYKLDKNDEGQVNGGRWSYGDPLSMASKAAELSDSPGLDQIPLKQSFETAAVCSGTGTDSGKIYGVVYWGHEFTSTLYTRWAASSMVRRPKGPISSQSGPPKDNMNIRINEDFQAGSPDATFNTLVPKLP